MPEKGKEVKQIRRSIERHHEQIPASLLKEPPPQGMRRLANDNGGVDEQATLVGPIAYLR
jgi:hypothetical protein